ncbi:CUGBP Elav-like family member 3 [Liolophura sinensis]|uniref:CUGBP Elav-like family member 3 n=1 Tax=Liolophura sinensis TaxID=3198878 RepID=UPI0031594D51
MYLCLDREKEGTEVKLFVKGIPNELTQEGLKNLFLEFGEVLSVKKCISKFPEQGVTFGFVSFKTIREALAAIKKLDGFQITSRFHLKVRIALSDEERTKQRKKREVCSEFCLHVQLQMFSSV